jgi:hypothetical protein
VVRVAVHRLVDNHRLHELSSSSMVLRPAILAAESKVTNSPTASESRS